MHTINPRLRRRSLLLGALGLLSITLIGCGQPQTGTTAAASPVASAAPVETTTMATEMPTATEMPMATEMPTAMPTEMPMATEMPMTSAAASPAASAAAHNHMASDAAAAQPGGPEQAATIKLFTFSPEPLTVKAGTTVVWTNQDNIEHSVTSGSAPDGDGAFDSDFFTQGQTFAHTFSQPGQFSYFCKRHNSMVGTVTVTP